MTPRISRRAFLGVTGLITGAAAIPGLTPARVLAQSEKPGGLLCVSVTFGLSTINPIMHISGAEWMATKWMYNNLTRLNAKREPVPDLAESWSAGDGARVWTFKLRQGVRFHHGRELVAEDVVATFTTLLDPKTASPYRGEVGPVDRVEALDKSTVRFTMKSPFSVFPAIAAVPNARIVAREGLADMKALASREFGTGPFKLKEFVPGDRVVVDRFADHVENAAQSLGADRHHDRIAGIDDLGAAHQPVRGVHRDRAHGILAEMLCHFEDQRAAAVIDVQRV